MDISNDKSAAPAAAKDVRLTPTQAYARSRDERWFSENPNAKWRVRPLLAGESKACDEFIAAGTGMRGYAIVIPHAKLEDRRAADGLGVYTVVTRGRPTKGSLAVDAARMVAGFAEPADPVPRPPLVIVSIPDNTSGPFSVIIHFHGCSAPAEGQVSSIEDVKPLMDKLELDFGVRPKLVIDRPEASA